MTQIKPALAAGEYAWLDAERRARDFLTGVRASASDPALRAPAQEMAVEEPEHIALVEQRCSASSCPVRPTSAGSFRAP